LKNSLGTIAKFDPDDGYNYMGELYGSPYQRLMIAEINQAYRNYLIIMDGPEAFVNGGPDRGDMVEPGVIRASTGRAAIDAVGVAILGLYGNAEAVSRGKIFEQDFIFVGSL